jgi:hypothetical protein
MRYNIYKILGGVTLNTFLIHLLLFCMNGLLKQRSSYCQLYLHYLYES